MATQAIPGFGFDTSIIQQLVFFFYKAYVHLLMSKAGGEANTMC